MNPHYTQCAELKVLHEGMRAQIRDALAGYASVPRDKYFYELCFCLMTPQSSAAHAMAVQQQLEQCRFFEADIDPEPFLRMPSQYIRFHKTKAKRLIEAKDNFAEVMSVLTGALPAREKREWLAERIDGLSFKEATHLLRNIGLNDGLAILDVHILRCLVRHGVIDEIPSSLSTKRYCSIEQLFQDFATAMKIPIDELDLVFWSGATGFILK